MLPRTEKPKPPTQRQHDKARTRLLIISTATRLFNERDYDGVSHRDIAGAIGMSTGAVMGHFADKQAIWKACMGISAPSGHDWIKAISALEVLAEIAKDLDDCGPSGEGWQSPELMEALEVARDLTTKARGQ